MLAATIKKQQRRRRNRDDPVVLFGLEIIEALEALLYTKPQESVNTWGFHVPQRAVRFGASGGHALTNFRYGRGAGVGRGPGGGGGTTMTAPVIPEEQCAKQK